MKTSNDLSSQLAHLSVSVRKAINRDLPLIVGNEASHLFRQNFQKEGFFGKKWKEVQRRQAKVVSYKTKGGKSKTKTVKIGKGADGSRKILTGRTSNLGRSLKVRTEPGKAIIYSDVKYSLAHNEGTANAGRGRRTKIPQRRFIGDHPVIYKAIKAKIDFTMNKIFK